MTRTGMPRGAQEMVTLGPVEAFSLQLFEMMRLGVENVPDLLRTTRRAIPESEETLPKEMMLEARATDMFDAARFITEFLEATN